MPWTETVKFDRLKCQSVRFQGIKMTEWKNNREISCRNYEKVKTESRLAKNKKMSARDEVTFFLNFQVRILILSVGACRNFCSRYCRQCILIKCPGFDARTAHYKNI